MANFKLTQTGEQIQADLDLLDKNSATSGQVLTANGTGGASWQNASGGGGSGGGGSSYLHTVFISSAQNESIGFTFTMYSSSSEAITIAYLRNYITQYAYAGLYVHGYVYLPTTENAGRCLPIVSIATGADDNEAIVVQYYNSSSETTSPYPFAANSTCDDLVSQI